MALPVEAVGPYSGVSQAYMQEGGTLAYDDVIALFCGICMCSFAGGARERE
jgi:hypothetical protein